ncbi:uncharacterized protein EV422DRAFT_223597 [Fimicolochytrium jonesii]|uniref:uncharacterized protein n=1 Tax=Fimicolochytrium jonesii TaxID=1396493 RepID=UPI0022FF1D5C|nr:uncharacterized protein EV422DRAFT_223597 [Fimicolochytrium jonesii]KAI8817406.1 hypothetical protein EV422DRAFT_223597 [Fimicolochytrium jonesii]
MAHMILKASGSINELDVFRVTNEATQEACCEFLHYNTAAYDRLARVYLLKMAEIPPEWVRKRVSQGFSIGGSHLKYILKNWLCRLPTGLDGFTNCDEADTAYIDDHPMIWLLNVIPSSRLFLRKFRDYGYDGLLPVVLHAGLRFELKDVCAFFEKRPLAFLKDLLGADESCFFRDSDGLLPFDPRKGPALYEAALARSGPCGRSKPDVLRLLAEDVRVIPSEENISGVARLLLPRTVRTMLDIARDSLPRDDFAEMLASLASCWDDANTLVAQVEGDFDPLLKRHAATRMVRVFADRQREARQADGSL